MRLAHLTFALAALLMLPACSSEASSSGAQPTDVATKIVDTLKGITDGETANAAKTELSTLTDQLAKAMESLKSAGGALADKAGSAGGLADAAKDLAGKAADAFAPELKQALSGITEQVSRLMNIESVTAAIGPILEKLKGLVTV